MTLSMFFNPFFFLLVGFIFLAFLSRIMLAPPCVEKMVVISALVILPLYMSHGRILHAYIQIPDKSALQVYEGKVYFSFGRKGAGTIWQIIDKKGESHTLFCAMSGSFIMSGCHGIIDKGNFRQYNGKQAAVHYSEKFGIMEAIIEGEKIHSYDEKKEWFNKPIGLGDTFSILSIATFSLVFIVELFKNFSLLVNFFSNPLRWRRQEILRYKQLLKEKDAKNV